MAYRLILFGLTGALLSVASAQSHQYYFVNTSLTWTEAQSVCRQDYTDLATIESTADVDDFLSTTSGYTGKAWIGLYDDTINSWKWSLNDSSFYGPGEYSFRNWQIGQPDDYYGQQHCVRFYGSIDSAPGQWDDIQCMVAMQFVCYNGTVGDSPSYVLSDISLTWTGAQIFCRENYVDLASVRNQTENEIIRTLIGSSTVWIGLYREKLWSDGSDSLFRYWGDGQPNDPSGDQCVAGSFNDSGTWSDESCSLSLPFVCYKPLPPNAEGFTASAQDESSITLKWNKININTSFILLFNGVETFIRAPDGDGPVNYTVSSLSAGINYTFTLYSVLDNIRSSGVSITAATACSGCNCCPDGTECITTNGVVQCIDPCATYTVLNDSWRSTENTDNSLLHSDQYIAWSGWYRFYLGQISAQIPENCVASYRCGTYGPLWINGAHPVQLNETVTRTVCNTWYGSCCYFPTHTVQIKRCYGYYVYQLQQPYGPYMAYCTESQPFRVSTQDESSITLQWNKINSSWSFILQFNSTEINITAPDGVGPVIHTVSSLTAGTRYTFTLFSVFENVRINAEQLTAVTVPPNADGFTASAQDESSITLQWSKVNNSTSFVLQFNGVETFIRAPVGDGPVTYTVSSLTAGTNYTFTLFSVLDNIRSSGVSITAATGALLSVASAQSHQYYFVNTPLTWTEAQSVCRRDYTDLATIESTADVDDFLLTSSNYTGKAWLGLYDDIMNSWKWSLDDSSFYGPGEYSFRNWEPGQPDDFLGQQYCVRFYGSSDNSLGQWDDAECMVPMEFVCYNGTVGGSPSYVLSSISLNWTEAQKFCRENYVDLASVRNQTENEIIRTLIGSSTVWIGLYREKLWSDGSDSLFRYWADGEPNDPSGDQCVAGSFNDSGRWSDENCSLSYPFVCYKPIPPNAEGFTASVQDESSITLQWSKVNNSTSFVLLFNGVETFIRAPVGDEPVIYTVSSLFAGTNYTFTLFSVLDNIRSSGVSITAATAPCSSCQCCPSGTDCITTNGAVQCIDPCVTYAVLNDAWRSTENTDISTLHCDQYIVWSGWYRFYLSQISAQIPENCVAERRCGTHAPLWINGAHPVQLNETVTRTVCNAWAGSCCNFLSHTIQIKRCYGYYVYKLQQPSACWLAYCTEPEPLRVSTQDESSITLQWNKINSSISFVLQFNGTEINITAPDGVGPVNYTVSSLTAGTKYTFTLFTVFENVRISADQLTAVTAPRNAEGFMKLAQDVNSITLQWNKININTSFFLLFNGVETLIRAPDGDGPVTYTVSSLTAGTRYTFTLFSVFENVRSSGVSIAVATVPSNAQNFRPSSQDESSITLQWNKINNNISFVLQFNGSQTFISSPDGDGPVTHTVSFLTAGTRYTFTLISVLENLTSSGISIAAATAPENAEGLTASDQDESSITLQWNKINNSTSFILQFNGIQTFISSPDADGPVIHTVSSLTAGTTYTFTLFSVFETIRSSGVQLTAVTVPANAKGFRASEQDESSITLRWNKVGINTNFVLQFNDTETNISSPDGDGPVKHTVTSLTTHTNYTFTLFSVFENIRSSGVSILATTGPNYVLGLNLKLEFLGAMTESEMEDALIELFREYNLPPQFTLKILSSKPSG